MSGVPALHCGPRRLPLDTPQIMGVINMTPDSFSDGAKYLQQGRWDLALVTDAAARMVEDGAAILDVGGESTRPGATPVSVAEELARVVPVIERLSRLDVVISVDTSKPEVARAAVEAGATLINDVRALQAPGMLALSASLDAGLCLMHMQGEPDSMQVDPRYRDVVSDVCRFLQGRVQACLDAGIDRSRLLVDPGFGFGKSLTHNLQLLDRLAELQSLNVPLLVGMSRKSMLGRIVGRDVGERVPAGLAAAVLAVARGAAIVRTHDVAETRDALLMCTALRDPARFDG